MGQAVQSFQPGVIQWIGMLGDLLAPVQILGSLAIVLTTYRFVSFRARQLGVLRRRRQPELSQNLV